MSGIVGDNTNRGSGTIKSSSVGADDITGAEIADDSIDSEHYVDGSIDNAHIADDAIDSEHYAAASIDEPHLADNSVDSRVYVDGSIDPEHLADNAVTLAKMASGTDGNIISYDASGDPVAIATGSDGQVLTSTGAGSPPAFETPAGGGSWTLIGTGEASNSASITITGLDSTYDTYACVMSALVPQTNGRYVWLRVGDSSGIDEGASDYSYNTFNKLDTTGTLSTEYDSTYHAIPVSFDVGNTSGYGYGGMYFLHCPGDSGVAPLFSGTYTNVSAAGRFSMGMGNGARKTAITLDRIQCLFATGNITSGRFSVYGIAHA
tara:strand:+ start:545 stop:1504 length:960 start_codon:yes stop_codon:yes gene_type:complete